MQEIVKQNTEKFFAVVWEDVIGYLKLYDYIKLKLRPVVSAPKSVDSVSAFWYSLLGSRFAQKPPSDFVPLRDGDLIRIKNVFLSEWSPKLPGQVWTVEGRQAYTEGKKHILGNWSFNSQVYQVLDPEGKSSVVSAGYGSVRINRGYGTTNNFMYMALTDKENWCCDHGIPVVVSESVYNSFQKYAERGAPWIQELEGVLHINDDLPFKEFIPKAIGASLSSEVESALRYRPNLPKCYIHIVSPLSVKFRYNDSHPTATAWTMFEREYLQERFSYTYSNFDPSNNESLMQAVAFLKQYAKQFGGKRFVTDFDGQVPRLESTISLESNPLENQKHKSAQFIQQCDEWVISSLR
jgi:hypothetical protein